MPISSIEDVCYQAPDAKLVELLVYLVSTLLSKQLQMQHLVMHASMHLLMLVGLELQPTSMLTETSESRLKPWLLEVLSLAMLLTMLSILTLDNMG
jgi:hypothetical protein